MPALKGQNQILDAYMIGICNEKNITPTSFLYPSIKGQFP